MIDIDSVVDDIMREFPSTIRVFLDFHMHCVGCPIARFHTVSNSCRDHGVDAHKFLAALRSQINLRNNTEMTPADELSLRRA